MHQIVLNLADEIFTKAHGGPLILQVEIIKILDARLVAVLVLEQIIGTWIGENNIRTCIQNSHTLFKKTIKTIIAVGSPLEVVTPGKVEHPVEVGVKSDICLVAVIANSRVRIGKRAAYFLRIISRGIVRENKFYIVKTLPKN